MKKVLQVLLISLAGVALSILFYSHSSLCWAQDFENSLFGGGNPFSSPKIPFSGNWPFPSPDDGDPSIPPYIRRNSAGPQRSPDQVLARYFPRSRSAGDPSPLLPLSSRMITVLPDSSMGSSIYPPQALNQAHSLVDLWEREDDIWQRQRIDIKDGPGGSSSGGSLGRVKGPRRRLSRAARNLARSALHISPGAIALEVARTGVIETMYTERIIMAQILVEADRPLSTIDRARLQQFSQSWGYPIYTPKQIHDLREQFNATWSTTRFREILDVETTLISMAHTMNGTGHTPATWLFFMGQPTLKENGFYSDDPAGYGTHRQTAGPPPYVPKKGHEWDWDGVWKQVPIFGYGE